MYRHHNTAIREGGMYHEEYHAADTARRLEIHAELHDVEDPGTMTDHDHIEPEDWEELEGFNGD